MAFKWPRRARATDEPSDLETIYVEYFPKIWRYMNYRVGPSEGEDLAAEVFVRVLQNLERRRGSIRPWIFRIAHNLAVDHLKSARVRREVVMGPHEPTGQCASHDPRSQIGLRIDLFQALDQLTDEQREVITLKFFLGMDNHEIEAVTGRKPEAVRALQYRALATLRRILRQEAECK